jgi:hypothetical protein
MSGIFMTFVGLLEVAAVSFLVGAFVVWWCHPKGKK